ncbi:MAG: cytochrome c oxidase assembly protein, partial [Mycobacterium sp.]|nr:cytochrome c oxidase assembly protein [Mycobacterium sp.]
WEWHLPLLIPAVVGVVALPVTGGAGEGPDHDYATSTVIVFAIAVSVWAGLRMVAAVAPPDAVVHGRVRVAGLGAAAVALLYGIALVVLRVGLENLTTAYGWLAITGGAA